jgi:hypothetical protein
MADLEKCDILRSEIDADSGEVRFTVGEKTDGTGFGGNVAAWGGCPNVIWRSVPADKRGACQGLYADSGLGLRLVGALDPRLAKKVGTLQDGDYGVVSDGPARFFLKTDGSIVSYSENKKDDGAAMMIEVNAEDGVVQIVVSGSIFSVDKDTITMTAGGTTLSIGPNGLELFGVAGMAGVPAPSWTVSPA